MTLDEIISNAEFCANEYKKFSEIAPERSLTFKKYEEDHRQLAGWLRDYKRLKEQESCEDTISRQWLMECVNEGWIKFDTEKDKNRFIHLVRDMAPPAQPKIEHCKVCKYFEYDSVAKVDGIPLIVAHEICSRWGDGCKTKEDGYCFLFEPQESEDK